jgi:flagellar biogenesis protein FliO
MTQDLEPDRAAAALAHGVGGVAGWLLSRLRNRRGPPRLAVLERIALAPRQSLALVEAEGRRFLVATSAEATPAFYALDEPGKRAGVAPATALPRSKERSREHEGVNRVARVRW